MVRDELHAHSRGDHRSERRWTWWCFRTVVCRGCMDRVVGAQPRVEALSLRKAECARVATFGAVVSAREGCEVVAALHAEAVVEAVEGSAANEERGGEAKEEETQDEPEGEGDGPEDERPVVEVNVDEFAGTVGPPVHPIVEASAGKGGLSAQSVAVRVQAAVPRGDVDVDAERPAPVYTPQAHDPQSAGEECEAGECPERAAAEFEESLLGRGEHRVV